MPALNFQKQFAPLVESGKKRQTIRAIRKRPFMIGDTLYLYTGMRTKSCRKLGEEKCKVVANIFIYDTGVLKIGNSILNRAGRDEIARRDGFDNWNAMWLWFRKTHGFPFEGQLIIW